MSVSAYFGLEKEDKAALKEGPFKSPPITIHDARALQDTYASPAAFFKEHGFCLLHHKTNVKEWNVDYANTDN